MYLCGICNKEYSHVEESLICYQSHQNKPVSAPVPERTNDELSRAKMALRNLIIEAEYIRTGELPSVKELDRQQLWWLTHATEPHRWDVAAPVPEPEPRTCPTCRSAFRCSNSWHRISARKDEDGTCDKDTTPHTKSSCPFPSAWRPVAPQASPEAPAKEMSNDPRVIVTYIWSEVETGTYAQAETILEAYVEQRMARARFGLSGRAE